MISFKHAQVGYRFDLNPGTIINLSIENPKFYRSFVCDLQKPDSEVFSFSEDGKELEFGKSSLLITDLFDFDPNSKKILMAIYKKIDQSSLTPERQRQFDEINHKIADLAFDIASDFEGSISFNDQLALPQILGLIDFKFDYDDSTFLSAFVSYLKAWREATNLKLVFVLNLFALLDVTEIDLLSNELAYCGLSLINVAYFSKKTSNKNVKSVVIDNDLCEIY